MPPFFRLFFIINFYNISKSELFVVQNAILGIMITADWIASNSYVFDNQQYENVDEFLESRKTQALKFLNKEGMIRQQIPVLQNFWSTFGFNGRPVQNDVEKIVHKNDIKCMLIESDCGSGKTEAALYAAAVLGNRSEFFISTSSTLNLSKMFAPYCSCLNRVSNDI